MARNDFERMWTDETKGGSMGPAGFCDHTYEKYLNHWIGFVIKPLLPEDARIETSNCFNDPCLWIDWEVRGGQSGAPEKVPQDQPAY